MKYYPRDSSIESLTTIKMINQMRFFFKKFRW